MRSLLVTTLALFTAAIAFAQTPPPTTKQNPPPGVAIPDAERKELEAGVASLGREIETLRGTLKTNPGAARAPAGCAGLPQGGGLGVALR